MSIYKELLNKGKQVFLSPDEVYPASRIISGITVNNGFENKLMRAIDKNTYRGFHKANKSLVGPKELIEGYFKLKIIQISNDLRTINSKGDFEQLSLEITQELREQLGINVKNDMLESYNKVRKLIDLLFEHLVSMAFELNGCREVLVPFLSIPLDSYILGSDLIFDQKSRKDLDIKPNSTYKDVDSQKQYYGIQSFVIQKAEEISSNYKDDFYPIYFDLIWNNRVNKPGKNLFKTNP